MSKNSTEIKLVKLTSRTFFNIFVIGPNTRTKLKKRGCKFVSSLTANLKIILRITVETLNEY